MAIKVEKQTEPETIQEGRSRGGYESSPLQEGGKRVMEQTEEDELEKSKRLNA